MLPPGIYVVGPNKQPAISPFPFFTRSIWQFHFHHDLPSSRLYPAAAPLPPFFHQERLAPHGHQGITITVSYTRYNICANNCKDDVRSLLTVDAAGCATFKLEPGSLRYTNQADASLFVVYHIALSALFPMKPIAPGFHDPKYCTHATHALAPRHANYTHLETLSCFVYFVLHRGNVVYHKQTDRNNSTKTKARLGMSDWVPSRRRPGTEPLTTYTLAPSPNRQADLHFSHIALMATAVPYLPLSHQSRESRDPAAAQETDRRPRSLPDFPPSKRAPHYLGVVI